MQSRTHVYVLAGVVLSSFLTPFMGSAVNIALPAIAHDLQLDAVSLNWVATSYLLASTTALIPMGRLADLTGRRRVFLAGIVLFTAASAACALAGSFGLLLAGRVVQGFGGAMIFSTGIALLTQVFPAQDRGRVLGWNVAVVYLGLSLGPFIGGALTQHAGWRSVFLAVLPVGLASAACIAAGMTAGDRSGQPGRFDRVGAVLYMVSLPLVIFGVSRLQTAGCALAAAGMAGLACFAAWERRTRNPLVDLGLFVRNRIFALSNLAALIHYAATFSQGFLLSLYLQYIKGLDPFHAGLVLIAAPVVMAALSPLAGALSDRLEPRYLASAGMALTTLALVFLARLGPGTGLGGIMAVLVLSGVGFAQAKMIASFAMP
ncbi:MAG TPA: MFS transporter, partial [Deltaproteobacteria bacterium]|nr:MFS transporter [Deltaproteobacteria bacterium]